MNRPGPLYKKRIAESCLWNWDLSSNHEDAPHRYPSPNPCVPEALLQTFSQRCGDVSCTRRGNGQFAPLSCHVPLGEGQPEISDRQQQREMMQLQEKLQKV
jgi:hypothetical protein